MKKIDSLKVPPQNLEAEQALLGSILISKEALNEVLDFINVDSFYADRHKLLWTAMSELHEKAQPIDVLSLSNKLREENNLDRIGGQAYIAEMIDRVPTSMNVKHYGGIVEKKSMMRKLISASDYISALGYNEAGELEEIVDKAEKRIFEVTNYTSAGNFVPLKDTLASSWERIEKMHGSNDDTRGVPTGFKDLDNKLSGLQPSDLIILAARPSVGKTSLALDIARQAAVNHNISVGIFSLEMTAQQLVDRMLAAESRVDAWKLRTVKNLNIEHDFLRLRDASDKLAKAPIYIDDTPANNILRMRSVARRLKSEKGLGLIVVDYLQLMVPVQSRNSDNVVQQVTEISRSLKNLARELQVPVLALSQLSRAVESRGGKPRLSDLRDSGSIEQDADVVMFIHREKDETGEQARSRDTEILIEKHRNGPTGMIKLHFDSDKSTFLSVDKGDFGDFSGAETSVGGF
jgi:replicative DNA helicase